MNNEPCVRLGIRISPKISEKPAESRNSRPPNVMLLTVSRIQKFIVVSRAAYPNRPRAPCGARGFIAGSGFDRREVARIDRLLEELLLVVGPELTHVVIGLDRLVDVFAARLLDA